MGLVPRASLAPLACLCVSCRRILWNHQRLLFAGKLLPEWCVGWLPCVVPCMMLHACVRSCWLVAVKTLTPATILSLAAYGRCDDGSGPRVQSIDGSGNNVNVRGACECTASTHMFVRQPITFPSGMSNADLIERAPATLALACV